MNLPKIEYTAHRLDNFNSANIIAVTLKNSSVSNATGTWTVSAVSAGDVSYSQTSDEYITVFCEIAVFDVLVTLTLSTGETSNIRLKSNGTYVAYAGIELDVFILPGNNVQFDTKAYSEAIVGSTTIVYTAFDFDSDSDSSIEDTSVINAVFAHTYSAGATATITATTSAGVLTTTIGVEDSDLVVASNAKELIVESVEECTQLEVWSQTENYIEKLIGRGDIDNSEMEYLDVTVTVNCCESQAMNFKLAPTYNFTLGTVDCQPIEPPTTVTIGIDDYQVWQTTLTLSGISADVIDNITYTGYNYSIHNTMIVNNNDPVTEMIIQFLIADSNPAAPVITEAYKIQVTTDAGFVYLIEYLVTPTFVYTPDTCDMLTLEITDITYPEYPCYVSVQEEADRTYLIIDSQLYNDCIDLETEELEPMVDGIYTIDVNDSGISNETVTGCEFVNCETRCLVIEALAKECNPIIAILYDALVDAKECDNITCSNYCDLYEMLQSLLTACDCSSYVNNKVDKRPCKTCKGGR